jgi:hypothetical protein
MLLSSSFKYNRMVSSSKNNAIFGSYLYPKLNFGSNFKSTIIASTGPIGPTGSDGEIGYSGLAGPTGSVGPAGVLVGATGSQGPTGEAGQDFSVSSAFVWSDLLSRRITNIGNSYQYVEFNKTITGPTGNGWTGV